MPYVNLNMRPCEIPLESSFEPLSKDKLRSSKWDVEDNMAPSVRDALFPEERHVQGKGPLVIKVETNEQAAKLVDKLGRAALNQGVLKDHSEERIQAFLMQIIACYDTNFHYTIGSTEVQTTSAPPIKFELKTGVQLPNNVSLEIKCESAHHGTLPCIYAYPRKEWTEWEAKKNPNSPDKPKAQVYLKHSDTYNLNNACTGLTKIINQGENNHLDGKASEKTVEFKNPTPDHLMLLREFTISLLNRAALKQIDPLQGLTLFMDKFRSIVRDKAANLPDGETKDTFVVWKKELDALEAEYQGNYKWFVSRLMGRFNPKPDQESLNIEELVFPRHCKLIQKKDLYQNQIAAKVAKLGSEILKKSGKTRAKARTFDKALKLAILENADLISKKTKLFFQRFYVCNGQSQIELERTVLKCDRDLLATAMAQEKINDFLSELSEFIHNFSIEESQFQSHILKEIRQMRDLSLRRFANKHNKMFPTANPLNHAQLSRIEKGCVKVTLGMAKRYSRVLDIHERVFKSGVSS